MALAMSSRRRLLDAPTRARAGRAKVALVVAAAGSFALAFGLTRTSHPSHAKHRLEQLSPPTGFVQQLQQDEQLRGGFVAAPQASPEAQTAVS